MLGIVGSDVVKCRWGIISEVAIDEFSFTDRIQPNTVLLNLDTSCMLPLVVSLLLKIC